MLLCFQPSLRVNFLLQIEMSLLKKAKGIWKSPKSCTASKSL